MKQKMIILLLLFTFNFTIEASSCYSPFRYNLTSVAKTIVMGRVKLDKGKYYVIVEQSWFPSAKEIEISPLSEEEDKRALKGRSYPLSLHENDWIFIMSTRDSSEKLLIPGCGNFVETVPFDKNKNFKSEKNKLKKEIFEKINRVKGTPKFFPNIEKN